MEYKELCSFLDYTKNEGKIFLPNEVFSDLSDNFKERTVTQVAFAYSYLYLVTYLYRYTKYGVYKYTQSDLKQILGYSPINKKVDFIIKKNGILEKMDYLTTTREYPIAHVIEEIGKSKMPDFVYNTDLDEEFKEPNTFSIKYPIKLFHRTAKDFKDKESTGTLYDVPNCHAINIENFLSIISDKNMGVVAFYILAWLKHKIDIYGGQYQRSFEKISEEFNVSHQILTKYFKKLEDNGYIYIYHQPYFDNIDKMPNVYSLSTKSKTN